MKHAAAMTLITVLGTAVVGCEAGEQEPGPEPAAEQERTAPEAPGEMGDAGEQPAATLRVDSLPDAGAYITDAEGRALYALEGEPEGESTCYDACAEEWPPLLVDRGQPAPGAATVQADQVGTLQRRDGERQATYAGHALYYYHDDQGPGQTEGHHLTDQWGEWYLVRPDGELLEGHEGGETGEGNGHS